MIGQDLSPEFFHLSSSAGRLQISSRIKAYIHHYYTAMLDHFYFEFLHFDATKRLVGTLLFYGTKKNPIMKIASFMLM